MRIKPFEALNPEKIMHAPPKRYLRFWISRFALLLGLPFLLYYGYCWGLLGRSSLLLQYLFQCNCPVASEEARYSKRVDVIIPACSQSYVELSPSGRFLQVYEEKPGVTSIFMLDLQTMERIRVTDQPFSSFLTDDLGFIESGLEDYIIDRTTGRQYPIQRFTSLRPDAYISGDVNLSLLAQALREAEHVFFKDYDDTIVALAPDFPNSVENNFVTGWFDMPGKDSSRVEQFLQENNVVYQTVFAGFPDEAISPDGRFVARADGIYLAETGQKIVEGYSLSVTGWIYDGLGVIYSHALGGRCLIWIGLPLADDTSCFRRVPQPVLMLKVPQEYLQPAPP